MFKSKVLNNPKPYNMKAKVQNKRKPIRTNHKRPIRLWVPTPQIVFVADMFQGKRKTTGMVHGQWILMTYKSLCPKPQL